MKKIHFCSFFVIVVLGVVFFAALSCAEDSGSSFVFENVLRGGYAEKTASISLNGQLFRDIALVGAIKDWLSVADVAQKDGSVEFKLVAKPPADAPLGVSEGFVVVNAISVPGGASSVVSSSVATKVSVGITPREIRQIAINELSIADAEEGKPLEVGVLATNEGNVALKPMVAVTVADKDKLQLKSFSQGIEILPTASLKSSLFVPSDGLKPGQYFAIVAVTLDGRFVREEQLPFELRMAGSLVEKGELAELKTAERALLNSEVAVKAVFKNAGETPLNARLVGNVFLGGTFVSRTEGAFVAVGIGEQKELSLNFMPTQTGLYKISGYAEYASGRQTAAKEAFVDARASLAGPVALSLNTAAIVFWLVLVVIIAIIIARGRHRRKREPAHRCVRAARWD